MDAILALLSGGATGLLGTGLGFVMRYFESKQKQANELALRQADMEMLRAEAEVAATIEARRAESEESRASWQALGESYQAATTRWSTGNSPWLVVVDVVRGLIRPTLTAAFCILTGAIYYSTQDPDITTRVVATVLYLTTVMVTWWFGERATKPKAA